MNNLRNFFGNFFAFTLLGILVLSPVCALAEQAKQAIEITQQEEQSDTARETCFNAENAALVAVVVVGIPAMLYLTAAVITRIIKQEALLANFKQTVDTIADGGLEKAYTQGGSDTLGFAPALLSHDIYEVIEAVKVTGDSTFNGSFFNTFAKSLTDGLDAAYDQGTTDAIFFGPSHVENW